jgi:cell division protein FtsA
MSSYVDSKEMIPLNHSNGRHGKEISRTILASIIEPRLEEVLSLVIRELRQVGLAHIPSSGVVLTGGGALLPGAAQLAEQIMDMPVRLGAINGIESTPDELRNPRYATVHGLLSYAIQHEPSVSGKKENLRGFMRKFENWIARQF